MDTYSLIIAPLLVALAALFTGLGSMLARHAYPAGARYAGFAMLAVAIWLAGAAGEILAADSAALYPLVRSFKYAGIAMVGPVYLLFVLRYAFGVQPSKRALAALLAVPVTTIALVWTNPLHELMWQHPFPALGRGTWGPWFQWVHTPYSYLTILIGTGGLVLETVRGSTLRRAQSSVLVIGSLVPLAVNAVYLANPELPDLSQTPLSFSVTAAVFGWGFFRFRLFQVSPLALKAAFDAVGDAVIVVDRERRVAELNPMARALLDPRGLDKPLGRPVEAALAAAGVDGVVLQDRLHRDLSSRDGRRLETDIRAIRDRRDAGIRGWIVILRDVTDQRRAEEGLRESEAMVRSVLDRSPIGILRLTPLRNSAGRIRDFTAVLANPTAEEGLVEPGESLVGRTLTDVRPPHTPLLMDALRRVMRTNEPEEMVIQVESPDAAPRWLRLNATPVGADVSLTFVDITGERMLQAEMAVAAHTDPLTGLLNRRGLAKDGEQLIASARAEGRALAVLFLDLDNFKEVNDRHGHDAGDATLREFALRVQSCLRAEDVLARVGGDEFVILLQEPGPSTEDDVAHRMNDALRTPLVVEDSAGSLQEVALRYSMGSARLSHEAADLAALLRTADAAMYRSKDHRRIPSGD